MTDSSRPGTTEGSQTDAAVANAMAEVTALSELWNKAVPTPAGHETAQEGENG